MQRGQTTFDRSADAGHLAAHTATAARERFTVTVYERELGGGEPRQACGPDTAHSKNSTLHIAIV
jgi:hypothetical protein